MGRVQVIVLLLFAAFMVCLGRPTLAVNGGDGAKIFSTNCTICHKRGGNLIKANKTLEEVALRQFGMYSEVAIVNQIKNGKNAMPAFGGRLSNEQIHDVAVYILEQADKGWRR